MRLKTIPAPIRKATRLAIESAIQAILDETEGCINKDECLVCQDALSSIDALETLLEERDVDTVPQSALVSKGN
jgi:hypothetical protein